jgi:hypothetical protein
MTGGIEMYAQMNDSRWRQSPTRGIARFALSFTWVAGFSMSLFASPLTITYSSTDSGTIGGTPFTNASFTITEHLDTANRQAFNMGGSTGFFINDQSASISISGVGVFSFTTVTSSFVNNTNQSAGFSTAEPSGHDLLALNHVAFATWDMTTSLGPFTDQNNGAEIQQWSLSPILTSGGTLVLNDQQQVFTPNAPVITFQAVITPEPNFMMLSGACLIGICLFRFGQPFLKTVPFRTAGPRRVSQMSSVLSRTATFLGRFRRDAPYGAIVEAARESLVIGEAHGKPIHSTFSLRRSWNPLRSQTWAVGCDGPGTTSLQIDCRGPQWRFSGATL